LLISLKEEGSSATDSARADVTDVTDVTDVSPREEGRRKKEEGRGRRKRGEGKSKNKEGFSYLAYKPYCRQNLIIQNIILIIT
jgi:hypothetical protein